MNASQLEKKLAERDAEIVRLRRELAEARKAIRWATDHCTFTERGMEQWGNMQAVQLGHGMKQKGPQA